MFMEKEKDAVVIEKFPKKIKVLVKSINYKAPPTEKTIKKVLSVMCSNDSTYQDLLNSMDQVRRYSPIFKYFDSIHRTLMQHSAKYLEFYRQFIYRNISDIPIKEKRRLDKLKVIDNIY